jgi:rhamnosyltransferase subunit B
MKFAIVTLGSSGDLSPFLAVARALTHRGHDVTLLSQAPYEYQVRAEGVAFRPVADEAAHRRTLEHPLLWHPVHGFGVLWRHLAVPAIEATCEILGEMAAETRPSAPMVVLASPMAAGARFARQRWPNQIRLLSGYTAPMGLRHIADPLFVGPWQVPRWVPEFARSGLWACLDHLKLEPMARPALSHWQRNWGTPPIETSAFGDWLHGPEGGVALYPEWFAPVPDQWLNRGVRQFDFPLFRPSNPVEVAPKVVEFVGRPSPYIVIYAGSAARAESKTLVVAIKAATELGLRALILGPHLRAGAHVDPTAARAEVLLAPQLPLSAVLPRAHTFVHHGGIGSVAEAFQCEVPQLIVATAYDQFENGAHVARLGAGSWCRSQDLTVEKMRGLLQSSAPRPNRQRPWSVRTVNPTSLSGFLEEAARPE